MKNLVDLVRLKNGGAKIYQTNQCVIQECEPDIARELAERRDRFNAAMNNLDKLQLRYSVLSLLSVGRVSLFNDSLIALVEHLYFPQNSGLDETAELSAFVLDQMTLVSDGDPVKMDLLNMFTTMMSEGESRKELKGLQKFTHLTPQYKVYVTPTLYRFAPASREEGSHILRTYKQNLYHFIRV